MRRRRAVPALISTIALIAGCGSEARVEVSGIVVDRATGRAIGGARVVSTDGSTTRTDASGRFTLSVSRERPSDLRASALAHVDIAERLSLDGDGATEIELALAPLDARDEEEDPDAVARFVEETWVDDAIRWAREHGRDETDELPDGDERGAVEAVRAAVALLGRGAAAGGVHRDATCADCHGRATRSLRDGLEADLDAQTCVSCHGTDRPGAFGDIRDRDGDGIAGTAADEVARSTRRAREALDAARRRRCGTRMPDSEECGLGFGGTSDVLDDVVLDLWILESDRSHGAHDAASAIAIARAIESSALAH